MEIEKTVTVRWNDEERETLAAFNEWVEDRIDDLEDADVEDLPLYDYLIQLHTMLRILITEG